MLLIALLFTVLSVLMVGVGSFMIAGLGWALINAGLTLATLALVYAMVGIIDGY